MDSRVAEGEGDIERLQIDPPDGGWGWICVIAAFMVNVITDGLSYSFGVLFVSLLSYFGANRSSTAWIGSLFAAVPLLCGPLASLVTNTIGYRKATILGGLITLVGFVSSFFVNSIEGLYLTYGVVAGLGISLPYLNSIVVLSEYFKKKRAFAQGLAECGAGVGTLIFAPLLERLIVVYGWRGALLIMGAISSNIIVCGCIFRPLSLYEETETYKNHVENQKDEVRECPNPVSPNAPDSLVLGVLMTESFSIKSDSRNSYVHTKSHELCSRHRPVSLACISHPQPATTHTIEEEHDTAISNHIPQKEKSVKQPSKLNTRTSNREEKWFTKFVDFTVMTNPILVTFTFTNFILYFWYDVPYVFTVDRAKSFGISEQQSSFIVACIGILHLIGNVVLGYLGDRPWLNRSYLYSVIMIACGLCLICVPFSKTYVPMVVLAGLFGLFSAATEALCSVIIADIIGVDRLTDAFGIVMFLQGVANLIGPPFAGKNIFLLREGVFCVNVW